MKVLSLVNQKGGVAKTTTAMALADGLARRGKKVLLIDFDPQASLTEACGCQDEDVDRPQALRFLGLERGLEARPIVLTHNLSIITSDVGLESANAQLLTRIGREQYLCYAINKLPEGLYDYVIIDSNPSLSVCTLNVLAASDYVIIPFKPEFGSFKGIDLIFENIKAVREAVRTQDAELSVLGFVVTMADARRTSTSQAIAELKARAAEEGTRVFSSHIRLAVAAADAPSHGKSIHDYAPSSSVAQDYEEFCSEVLEALEG